MSEESPVMRMQDDGDDDDDETDDNVLQRFQMRRTWESRYSLLSEHLLKKIELNREWLTHSKPSLI